MKKQIQLAGTYHTLKYIKNQFNLLKKKNTNNRHIVTIRVLNPAEKKKKTWKGIKPLIIKCVQIIHSSLYYIETVEINFIQEVNIPRSDSWTQHWKLIAVFAARLLAWRIPRIIINPEYINFQLYISVVNFLVVEEPSTR